jgi:hypothetical protein
MDMAMSAASLTSGKDRNDESQMATIISPNPPYGASVATSQAEIFPKNDILNRVRL